MSKRQQLKDMFNQLNYRLIVIIVLIAFTSAEVGYYWPREQTSESERETEIIYRTETFVDTNLTNMGRAHFYLTSDILLNMTIEWNASNRVMVYASWHGNEYCYDFSRGTVDSEWGYGGFLFRQVGMKGSMYLGPDYFDLTDGKFWSFGWNSQFLYGGERYYYGHVNMTYTMTLFIEREI